jgi:hypothetical protein
MPKKKGDVLEYGDDIAMPDRQERLPASERKDKYLTDEQLAAKEKSEYDGTIDKDLDGVPDIDQLDIEGFGSGVIDEFINVMPGLKDWILESSENGDLENGNAIGNQRFVDGIIALPDYQATSEYWKKGVRFKAANGQAAYDGKINEVAAKIRKDSTNKGVNLTNEEIQSTAEAGFLAGWLEPENEYLVSDYLENKRGNELNAPEDMGGSYANLADELRKIATDNGLTLDNSYFDSAVRSVESNMQTREDAIRDLRDEAAGNWPSFGDRIRGGSDARELASGFINTMARELEIDPSSIMLNDPLLRKAFTSVDDKGNLVPQSLWQFEMDLKNDPRWMDTNNAQNTISSSLSNIAKMMGGIG